MMPAMLRRHAMRRMFSALQLGGSRPMMDDRLHRFAIFNLRVLHHGALPEIFADVITRKNLRRYQPRADVSVMVTKHELVEAGLANHPIFSWWHRYWPAGSPGRPAENEGMDALAINDLDKGQFTAAFFDNYSRESAACGEKGEKRKGKKFGAHKSEIIGVVTISNPTRQHFL